MMKYSDSRMVRKPAANSRIHHQQQAADQRQPGQQEPQDSTLADAAGLESPDEPDDASDHHQDAKKQRDRQAR